MCQPDKHAFTFDLSKVPAPLFAALTFAGVALVAATAYSLGSLASGRDIVLGPCPSTGDKPWMNP